MLFMSNWKPILYGCIVTLVTIIFHSFMYRLNMPNKHTPTRWLIITLVTIKCDPIRLDLFVFCKMASCCRCIFTLVTDKLDSFMNRQFVFLYTGSLRNFLFALVTVISNLFTYGQFMKKKTWPCLEIYAVLVTHKFKYLMLSSYCGNPASRYESLS